MKFAAILLFCVAAVSPAQNMFTAPMPSSKVTIANVAETPRERHIRGVWLASIAAMTAGTAADAYSSWHKQESNSFLASSNGTFGTKGVVLKAGIASSVLIPQIVFRHHKEWHLAFAASNFLEAGIFTGATVHNLGVH